MADAPTPSATRIVAAVVSYETRDLLARCLESLSGVETWVVDNGSGDGSAALVREAFPAVRLEARSDNLGYGPAVNLVAEGAGDWDWLIAANADIAVEPGALDALLAAAAADPGAGILAPRLLLPDGRTQHSAFPFWSPGFALRFAAGWYRVAPGWGRDQCLPSHWDPDVPRRVPWALGAFLLVRREAWDAAGGFDPAQWLYAEDVDLGWRAAQAGWATRYVPDAHVRHEESAAARQVWGDTRDERWMAASYDWLERRQGRAAARSVAALHTAGATVRGQRRWARLHAQGLRRR